MTRLTSLTSVLALVAGGATAQEMNFNRIASFPTVASMAEGEDRTRESSAEIITAPEPEGMEFAEFGGTPYLFVLSDWGSIVGVCDMTDPTNPALKQLLPSGISPEKGRDV